MFDFGYTKRKNVVAHDTKLFRFGVIAQNSSVNTVQLATTWKVLLTFQFGIQNESPHNRAAASQSGALTKHISREEAALEPPTDYDTHAPAAKETPYRFACCITCAGQQRCLHVLRRNGSAASSSARLYCGRQCAKWARLSAMRG